MLFDFESHTSITTIHKKYWFSSRWRRKQTKHANFRVGVQYPLNKQKYKYTNFMQVMLMRLTSKGEYVIVPKGTKFTGLGKLGLNLKMWLFIWKDLKYFGHHGCQMCLENTLCIQCINCFEKWYNEKIFVPWFGFYNYRYSKLPFLCTQCTLYLCHTSNWMQVCISVWYCFHLH